MLARSGEKAAWYQGPRFGISCLIPALALLLLIDPMRISCQDDSDADNPPARVARITALKGNVSFLRAGVDQWSDAAINFPATTGDRIYTDAGARAELQVGPYTARLWEYTDLTIANLNDQQMQLGLSQGSLRITVRHMASDETVEVDTPNGAFTLLEQGKYRLDVNPGEDTTTIAVISGRVEITAADASQTLESGQAARLRGSESTDLESIPMPPSDEFDAWSEERDFRLTSSKSLSYVNPLTPGFDDLDEYGHWSVSEEYGPVWFPPVAADWVPYRFGRWVWIDPWGWTWVENEAWGFCPFHFGRWVLVGGTWGWLPGPIAMTPVYAPAFVAFLGGPGFISVGVDLVGWFPLGPGEPFFPWYHYTPSYLNVVNITNVRNVTNIQEILNVRDINNIHYAYRTIATTAVPPAVLMAGEPVAKQIVRVNPQQLARAQVIPHPPVNPTRQAVLAGRPTSAPPIRPQPRFINPPRPVPNAAAGRQPPGTIARSAPPETARRAPIAPERSSAIPPPRSVPPALITRGPVPRAPVPFATRRGAMLDHPGRPLEPPQVSDLREGRPLSPMRDHEFPPHPVPVVPERPALPAARPNMRPPHR